MMTRFFCRACLTLCVSTLLLVGCSNRGSKGPTGEVEGSVTIDGKPLLEGSVVFSNPTTGATDAAKLDSGKFKIQAPLQVGKYQVSFEPPAPPQPTDAASGKKARSATAIPAGYHAAGTTDQVADVKEGPNQFVFRLTKKGPKRTRNSGR